MYCVEGPACRGGFHLAGAFHLAVAILVSVSPAAVAEPLNLLPGSPRPVITPVAAAPDYVAPARVTGGGGLIEFLASAAGAVAPPANAPMERAPREQVAELAAYKPSIADYTKPQRAGTAVIHTPERVIYLVQAGGRTPRYGVSADRGSLAGTGVKRVSGKPE